MTTKKKPGRPATPAAQFFGWAAVTSRIHQAARAKKVRVRDIAKEFDVDDKTWWNYRNAKRAEPPGAEALLERAAALGWYHADDNFNDFLLVGELDPPMAADTKKWAQQAVSAKKWAREALKALLVLNAIPATGHLPLETSVELLVATQQFQRRFKEQSEFENQIAAARGG